MANNSRPTRISADDYCRLDAHISDWNMETLEPAVCALLDGMSTSDAAIMDRIFKGSARDAFQNALKSALDDIDSIIAFHVEDDS